MLVFLNHPVPHFASHINLVGNGGYDLSTQADRFRLTRAMSENFTPFARIEYLIRRRFPNIGKLRVMPLLSRGTPAPDTTKLRAAVETYRAELATLTPDKVEARYHVERAKEAGEIR